MLQTKAADASKVVESEDAPTASSEDGALSFAASEDSGADGEATAMYCPPSISIPPTHHEAVSLNDSDTMCEDDDKASSTDSAAPPLSLSVSIMSSPMATSLSLGSRSSHDAFPSSSTPSSLSSDRELVEQACTALRQTPGDVETLDLSTNTRKPRRPLKNLLALSDLSNLAHLDVSGNAVERLEGLQVLPQLQTLLLARNHLKTLSSPLFTLEGLTRLDLSGNFIAHLPRAIASLALLETLNLAGNNLSKLREVDVLAPLANLHVCSLAANPFCRLPTYKDYVVSKIQSLERLDDMQISPAAREKACKRFGAALYSQDACLREADRAHEHEHNKLLEAQSALEAENLRLKGELNVKSKLLQNKSRAWSSATEQLLQLQQEVAMLNLDRRRSVSLSQEELSGAELAASARHRLLDMNQQRPQSAPRVPSPVRSLEKRRGSSSAPGSHRVESPDDDEEEDDAVAQLQVRHHSPPSTPTHSNVAGFPQKNDRYLSSRQAFATNVDATKAKSGSKTLVDASCSPFRVLPPAISIRTDRERAEEDEVAEKAESRSAADSVQSDVPVPLARTTTPPAAAASSYSRQQLKKSQGYDQVRQALAEHRPSPDEATTFSTTTSCEIDLKEDEAVRTHELSVSRSTRFPTFEDDVACPAYEDEHHVMLQRRATSARDLNLDDQVGAEFYRTASSPDRLSASILSLPRSPPPSPASPSRLRMWFREQNELRDATPSASPPKQPPSLIARSSPSSPLASPLAAFVNKDVLARQIQALNSCKQSLLTEIGNEEQLLHVLKKEGAQYADQIDRLSVNIQACLDGDPSAVRFSFSPPASPRSRGGSIKQREEGVSRAHLEILRNKMRFAEDKEKEIETTMVWMTKRVLQADLHSTVHGATTDSLGAVGVSRRLDEPFDKEIFALTHKLQLVIVQKEEINMQMSQLMAQMRHQGAKAGGEDEAGGVVDSQNALALVKSRQMVSELRTRHREVTDRIQLKERRIASLLDELKDVEAELQHISRLNVSSVRSPLVQRERAASVDFCQTMRLKQESHCGLADAGDREHMTGILSKAPTEGNASVTTATNLPHLCVEAGISHETSEQGSFPFKLQFKELLTAEMLEDIKADIYEKLSQQLAATAGKSKDENFVLDNHKSLHDAIATALETRLKLAMGIYDQQKSDEDRKVDDVNTPAGSREEKSASALVPVQSLPSADEVSWGHFDEFAAVNTHYARRYVFVKKNVTLTPLESSSDIGNPASLKATSRLAGAQRILKACERLETAEVQSKMDPNSNIELDPLGNNRSSLKLLLLAARDLPTAHLRTKNLDPYVSMEVVYPAHVVPLNGDAPSGKALRSRTKKKSMYPIWDEEFELAPILSLNGYIHVRILNDRRLSREQLVGETRIPLHTLVHQKRIVEWFSLGLTVPPASTDSNPPGTVVSKLCGGAVRLQLQLNFSSVERYKRTVDELVTRYLHDHNQLPPFIEAVDHEQKPLFEEMEVNEYEQQQQQTPMEAQIPLDAFETSLPTYEIWKAEAQEIPVQNTTMAGSQKDVSSPTSCGEAATGALQGTAAQCLADRRQSLWDTKTPPARASGTILSGRLSPLANEAKKKALVDSSSSSTKRKRLQASVTSNATTRAPRNRPQGVQTEKRNDNSLQQHISLRRKGQAAARVETPECFDEYSPYHPAFKSADSLDDSNNDQAGGRSRHGSGPFIHVPHISVGSRRTDLRIFKSPSFARRQPTTGFPERYIGLDNQTCERLKRIFGRIDGNASS
ncbi:hypothetical protein BBJ28_00005953 [Nothophytophthora sp. Chile5]|nr:hypothetical protein BBJ28_00005953 [Nothophytophthora sp. Chile5]